MLYSFRSLTKLLICRSFTMQMNTLAMLTSNISGLGSLDIVLATNLIEQALQNATEDLNVCDLFFDSLFFRLLFWGIEALVDM